MPNVLISIFFTSWIRQLPCFFFLCSGPHLFLVVQHAFCPAVYTCIQQCYSFTVYSHHLWFLILIVLSSILCIYSVLRYLLLQPFMSSQISFLRLGIFISQSRTRWFSNCLIKVSFCIFSGHVLLLRLVIAT
jgi:hypothetical protein